MSSILNIFSNNADEFNTIILVPVVVVIVVVVFIFKLSFHKQDVTRTSQNSKKQKTVHTKKEDKLASTDKKERLANGNKKATKSSPWQPLATKAADTTTKLNKKHMPESEKPINNHTTKKQKSNSTNTTSNQNQKIQHAKLNNEGNKKDVKNVPNKNVAEEQGEWQTVTTKKQKPTKNENAKEVSVLPNNIEQLQRTLSKNKSTKKTKTNKEDAKSAPINLYTAADNINEELTPQEISTKSTSRQNIPCVDDTHYTTFTAVQQNHTPNVDAPFITLGAEVVNKDAPIFNTPIPQVVFNTGRDNVAFDKLGDGDWTDTKPQKKNKKRALRE